MVTSLSLFDSKLPAHVTNPKSKAMQAMAGGMAGGGFGNRISLRNSKFRFIQNGSETGVSGDATLDVVIFALAESVQRLYFEGEYQQGAKTPPVCFSHDGKTPSSESPKKQAESCSICPQNIKGSGRLGNSKACAYKKRVIVLAPDDLDGPPYSLDVSGMSMFGEQIESKNLYSFKGYYEKLMAHNMDISAIVTRLSFDDSASVPKLHFSPIRALSPDEFAAVNKRGDDDEVTKMLKDLTNIEELDEVPEPVKPVVVQAPTPPVSTPKSKGFGTASAVAVEKPAVPKGTKAIKVDLEDLVNFDD